jgi:A/G-specific adenine glycosylase
VQTDCVALQTNRVAELPTPRTRKAVPEKNSTFLLLLHGNDILLEKRAAQGIWGGLWCPPQIEDGQGVPADYVQRGGLLVTERIDLAEFTHTFTHFKLHITPVLLRVSCKPLQVQQTGSVWLDVDEALQGAIPAPVRKMLLQLSVLDVA